MSQSRSGLLAVLAVVAFVCAPHALRASSPQRTVQAQAAPQGSSRAADSLPSAPAAETRITEYAPPPDNYSKSIAYSAARYRHFFVDAGYSMLVLLVLLYWRIGPRYRDWAERVSSRRFVQALLYAPALLLTVAVLGLPADAWDQSLERGVGLSVQGWKPWMVDWITNQVITAVVGTILIGILYAVIRRAPRRWWLYFWMASIPVIVALFFVQPLVIEPLFFKFTPLESSQPQLVTQLERVVHHGGIEIPPERMFEMNASSKVTQLNAYVSGFGSSKRAVVWDNTIAKATPSEILFVFGHEMGHYVLFHIPQEVAIDCTILLVLLYVGYRGTNWALTRYGTRFGIRSIEDWASLPLMLLAFSVVVFFGSPAFDAVSRHFEHEADRYGLEVIHTIVSDPGQVAAHYFEKSGEINLADPDPSWFIKIWTYDHPTRPERVHFAATYNPWAPGGTPRYVP